MAAKNIDHAEYPRSLKSKPDDSLKFIIRDCREALKANPGGSKSGYYADEINYCEMELASRKEGA